MKNLNINNIKTPDISIRGWIWVIIFWFIVIPVVIDSIKIMGWFSGFLVVGLIFLNLKMAIELEILK